MTAAYRLSPRARADLKEIWTFTAKRWTVRQADDYAGVLNAAFEKIAENPQSGRACDELGAGYRRYSAGSHVIFYRYGDAGILVVRILHQSMDFDRRL